MRILPIIIMAVYWLSLPLPAQTANLIEIPLDFCNTPASRQPDQGPASPVKWSLALSGGGARGLAQIGVLKVLEQNNIQIRGIAGTSIGAVIGGLYAAGLTAAEIESLAYTIRWNMIMQNNPPRKQLFLTQKADKDKYLIQLRFKGLSLDLPSAFSSGQKLNNMITEHVLNTPNPFPEDFDQLPVRFRAVSTDLVSGQKVVMKSGSLIDAMRASMAIPLLFNPVKKEGAMLVDGGLVQNLPVDEARSLNADWVMAIDTSSKLRSAEELDAAWEIADQTTTIMQRERTISQLKSANVQIQPQLSGISYTDFEKIVSIIKAGEIAAKAQLSKILSLDAMFLHPDTSKSYLIESISWHDSTAILPDSMVEKITNRLPGKLNQHQIQNMAARWMQTLRLRDIKAYIDTSFHCLQFHLESYPTYKKITFEGNTVFQDSTLRTWIYQNKDSCLTKPLLKKRLSRLIEQYQKAGYSLCSIDTLKDFKDSLCVVLNEGRITEIQLKGNERTRPLVILREMKTQKGSLFQSSQIKQDIQNIYSTGLFEGIGLNINKQSKKHHLKIQLVEQGSFLVRAGIRHDNTRYMRGFVQFVEDNFYGTGTKVSFLGLTGKKDEKIELTLRSDRFFNTLFTYKLCGYYSKESWKYYADYTSVGEHIQTTSHFSFTLGQQMKRLGTFSANIASENIHISSEEKTGIPVGSYLLRNITIQSEVDTRDQIPFPGSGKYNLIFYETGGPLLGGDIAYMRIYSSMESYHALLKNLNFKTKTSWGSTDNGAPFPKKFTLGGYTSFAGLIQKQLVGKRFLLLSGTLRYRLPWPDVIDSYISCKYDFAGIWDSYAKIDMQDFFHGIGAAVSFKTPLGPVRFAYGETSNRHSRFYFSAGYTF